jgi:hypothetical protein
MSRFALEASVCQWSSAVLVLVTLISAVARAVLLLLLLLVQAHQNQAHSSLLHLQALLDVLT